VAVSLPVSAVTVGLKGNEMPKNKDTQPNLTNLPEETITAVQAMPIEEAEKVVSLSKAKGRRRNIFEREDTQITEAAQNKVQLVSETRQRLAEASDAYQAGGQHEQEGQEALDKAARLLVRGRVTGILSSDELTEIIGSQFGFKTKKDGTPSRTPEGAGNTVRQRIVRLVNAYDFADGGTAEDAFFSPIAADAAEDVKDVISQFEKGPEDGGITIWAAYQNLADIKRDNVQRVPLVFDAKKIAGIAEAISNDLTGVAGHLADDKALRTAYRSLWKMLNVAAEEAAELVDDSEAA